MKRAILSVAILAMAAGVALAGVSKDDVKKLVAAGISDDVIVSFVKTNGGMDSLSADDIIDLKKAGASEKLLEAILTMKNEPAAQKPSYEPPARQKVVERETVYVDRPVYTPTYYSYYPYVYSYPRYVYYPRYYPSLYYYPSVTLYYGHSRFQHHHGGSLYHRGGSSGGGSLYHRGSSLRRGVRY